MTRFMKSCICNTKLMNKDVSETGNYTLTSQQPFGLVVRPALFGGFLEQVVNKKGRKKNVKDNVLPHQQT